jgi:hypothetical protein
MLHHAVMPMRRRARVQGRLLSEAAAEIGRCDKLEASLFDMAQNKAQQGGNERRVRPGPPLLINRTSDSLTISHFPFKMRGGSGAASFAVYCKPFGAGVALSMNKTASQYQGTGVRTPLGASVTVQGLQPNAAYVLAIAAFDRDGRVIGELGTPQRWLCTCTDVSTQAGTGTSSCACVHLRHFASCDCFLPSISCLLRLLPI